MIDSIGEVRVVDSGRFDVVLEPVLGRFSWQETCEESDGSRFGSDHPVLEKSNLSVFWPCIAL